MVFQTWWKERRRRASGDGSRQTGGWGTRAARGERRRKKTFSLSGLPLALTSGVVTSHGDPNEEARAERLYTHRADDRRGDHRHSRGDRDPELHQVPGAVEAERSEGEPQGHLHGAEGVLPGEGPLLYADR